MCRALFIRIQLSFSDPGRSREINLFKISFMLPSMERAGGSSLWMQATRKSFFRTPPQKCIVSPFLTGKKRVAFSLGFYVCKATIGTNVPLPCSAGVVTHGRALLHANRLLSMYVGDETTQCENPVEIL